MDGHANAHVPVGGVAEQLPDSRASAEEWARAVEIDRGLRTPGAIVNRSLDQALYLHRQCIPLEMVDLEAQAAKEAKRSHNLFSLLDCGQGMCGV
jgi:hypothetical protein